MFRSVALSAGLIAGANAFWRMECPGRVSLARIDPIVNPDETSPHAHSVHGSSAFSMNSRTSDLMDGDCTSCRVTQDKSAYWTPAIYFEDAGTKKVELVPQVGGMLAYYLLYGDNITAFPEGFQMISGSNDRRSYTVGDPSQPDPPKSQWASLGQTKQEDLAQRAIGYNCLNYQKNPEGTLYRHFLPEKTYLDQHCTDGLRFELMFPSCWDGKNMDSDNHKDHVAFPDLVMTGSCPPTHPVRLPSMLFETIWNTAAFKNRNGRFVLSNGDTSGYAYHGDFITGWDSKFLQQAVDTCTNPSGRIQDCPLFNVVDEGEATSCKVKKSLPQVLSGENVLGPMNKLPGDISVGGAAEDHDHGNKKKPAPPPSSTKETSAPTLTYRPGEKASTPAAPLPGQVFKQNSHSSVAQPKPTIAPVVAPAALDVKPTTAPAPPSADPSFFSTQYITNGNQVTKVLWEESFVTVTEDDGSPTAAATPAVGHKHRRHVAHHAHAHGKF
ncbi:hypothetical protein QQS21_003062 [Conoideocrella luteorostrata]|uniref:DUF1996 domain-containing protein n=1 Tax=Conoideocrella luteorostrata TaxID=1105319 RepID=A0AAJ0CTX9_9HYPO|nr:hypothetical protein QQS21_003062 [Conoideocrella luteorostrata]